MTDAFWLTCSLGSVSHSAAADFRLCCAVFVLKVSLFSEAAANSVLNVNLVGGTAEVEIELAELSEQYCLLAPQYPDNEMSQEGLL